MATKHDDPCRDKADDDEPIFTLRAQDELAEGVVFHWVQLAARAGVPDDRVRGATEVCGGEGGEVDPVLDDGTGPWLECGWCEGTGRMTRRILWRWLLVQRSKRGSE